MTGRAYGKKFDLETYGCTAGGSHEIMTLVDPEDYPYGACSKCGVPSRDLDAALRAGGVKARQYKKPMQSSRVQPPRKSRSRQGPRIR